MSRANASRARPDAADAAHHAGTVDPVAAYAARGAELSGPALRAFLAIADGWRLDEGRRLRLLGSPPRSTYFAWAGRARAGGRLVLPFDTLTRISALLGVHKALSILFERPDEALSWLRGPHDGRPFAGRAPLDLMASGLFDDLLSVRRYLDAWRGGAFAEPDADPPAIADDEIVFVG